ncbi:MAG: hypothetical protein ACRDNS_07945 [Trebonia sp.]
MTHERGAVVSFSWAARQRLVFVAVAGACIVAGGVVAAVNGEAAFARGSWLAAYLVLVGGVAQLLLGVGCLALPEPVGSARLRRAQLGLWNAGIGIVAGGVLADALAVVLVGSAVVVVALGCFALGGGPISPGRRTLVLAYRALIIMLMVGVVVGGALTASGHAA